ncbi:MAG TPA: hypothetical protein VIJ21_02180 [Solirubrobacterales bacterium]
MIMFDGYRDHLQAVIAATAAPYGYTLTIWTTAAIVSDAAGPPDGLKAVLFLGGALLAFASIGTVAHGRVDAVLSADRSREVRLWGALHIPAIGLAIAETTAIVAFVNGPSAFPLTGFAVTFTYVAVIAAQFTFAEHDRGGPTNRRR